MANICESAITVINGNKRKWLIRLNQKVPEEGETLSNCVLVTQMPPGPEQAPKSTYFTSGTWKSRIAPFGDPMNIALWMGHESLQTTQMYLDANLELKEKILAKVEPRNSKSGRYRPDSKLATFLKAL